MTLCFFLLAGVDAELLETVPAGDDAPDGTDDDSAPVVGEGAARADGGGGACKVFSW